MQPVSPIRAERHRYGFVLAFFASCAAQAELTIEDQLNGASSAYPWQSIGGACLTAGDGTGSIPSCYFLTRIREADPVGRGVLRLTDAKKSRSGALLSKFTVPSNAGLQVSFTTLTWGGNGYINHGADGMSFFLLDSDRVGAIHAGTALGSFGGSLGYSRSVGGIPGIKGGYIGVGIDEHGNFSNPLDNGSGGPGFRPNTISVRGSEAGGYRYMAGSQVLGSIAQSAATTRAEATPITFDLRISRDGRLNVAYSRAGGYPNPVLHNVPIAQDNGKLPEAFYFGFAGSTGYGTNIHEISCFKAQGIKTSGSSAGSNLLQSAKVQLGSQVYLAYYRTDNWLGSLTAKALLMDPATEVLSVNPVAQWDANCGLSGGYCAATGRSPEAQEPEQRTLLGFDGSQGIALRWDALPAAARAALGNTPERLHFLRGDRRQEGSSTPALRRRPGVLGDIMHSSPVWLGSAQLPPDSVWTDTLHGGRAGPEAHSYRQFSGQVARRTPVVYVGANDGMLHGFRAGTLSSGMQWGDEDGNDGRELLGYMPQAALLSIHSPVPQLDYSHPQYAHNAFVDATPAVAELFYGGAWHTWLVSGMGGGGNRGGVLGSENAVGTGAVFALDVTDPQRFSEAQAASLVRGEWSAGNVRCPNDGAGRSCGVHLGNTYGTPLIRRLHNGNWAVIFGNGFHSASGRAGVYVLSVAQDSGAIQAYFLDTGVGTPQERNGIAYVSDLDIDNDRISDYLYAGDLAGNVWRFDLTSAQAGDWRVRPQALFQTGGAPITTQVLPSVVRDSGPLGRVVLVLGTGQILPQTLSAAAIANPRAHHLFGVWDWDLQSWNQKSRALVHALPTNAASAPASPTLLPSQLQLQTLTTHAADKIPSESTGQLQGVRTITSHPVCWAGLDSCPNAGASAVRKPQFGWRVPLPEPREQIIYSPVLYAGLVHVSTAIPSVKVADSCSAEKPMTGFTLALSVQQGSHVPGHLYHAYLSGDARRPGVVGLGLGAVGTPSFISANGADYLLTQTARGDPSLTRLFARTVRPAVKRRTWKQVR